MYPIEVIMILARKAPLTELQIIDNINKIKKLSSKVWCEQIDQLTDEMGLLKELDLVDSRQSNDEQQPIFYVTQKGKGLIKLPYDEIINYFLETGKCKLHLALVK